MTGNTLQSMQDLIQIQNCQRLIAIQISSIQGPGTLVAMEYRLQVFLLHKSGDQVIVLVFPGV